METGSTHLRNREGPGPGGCQTFPPGAHGPPRASLLSLLRIFRPSSWAEPGLHGEGVSMTAKKGGGSESLAQSPRGANDDQPQDAHGPQHTTHGRLTAGDDSGTRAATPGRAAANPAAFCPCPDCGRELGHDRATLATMDWRDERIRALEAELAALEKGAVEGSWRARAEKAEARVKELEDRFALEEEANAELRGEDSR